MKSDKFLICAKRLHPRQAIYITFANNTGGIDGLTTLLSLQRNRTVLIDQNALLGLTAVAESKRWERISRTVPVYDLAKAPDVVLEQMAPNIESVVAGDHFAKDIFTGSKPKQEQAAQKIIAAILTEVFVADVEGWTLKINGELFEIEGLPAIKFTILNGHLPVVRFCLDGFTGRYKMNNEDWSDTRCTDAGTIQKHIAAKMESYLDTLSSSAAA